MNHKVLKAMVVLTVAFLAAQYVIKLFVPEWFVLQITNDKIVAFGNFVDKHWWADTIATFVTAFATYWLFICAVCKKWKLSNLQIGYVLIAITTGRIIHYFAPDLALMFSLCVLPLLAFVCKADLKPYAIVYIIHVVSQGLSLSIRNIQELVPSYNFATFLLLSIDMYFWLILLYLLNNYKGDSNMGEKAPPLYGVSKFYTKKLAKVEKRIAKLQAVKAECEKELAKKNETK